MLKTLRLLLTGNTEIEDPNTVEPDYCDADLTTLELADILRRLGEDEEDNTANFYLEMEELA